MKNLIPILVITILYLSSFNLLTAQNCSAPPVAKCQAITVQLDADCEASIAPSDIDNGSFDNCSPSGLSMSLNKTMLDASNMGDQPEWQTMGGSIVPNSGGSYIEMAIAPDGTPYYIITNNRQRSRVSVFRWDGSAWRSVGPLTISYSVDRHPSIDFAPDGTPYISYRDDRLGGRVTVKKWTGTYWQTIGSGISLGRCEFTTLKVAPDGKVYVAFQDQATNPRGTTVMRWDGSSWTTLGNRHIGGTFSAFQCLGIGLDGNVYVGFRSAVFPPGGEITRAYVYRWTGSTWQRLGGQASELGNIDFMSLDVAPDGSVYIAYGDRNFSDKVTVRKWSGSSWATVGKRGISRGRSRHHSIFVGSDGTPYVGYEDNANGGKANVMRWNGSSWDAIGGNGISVGPSQFGSISVGLDGTPYYAYRNDANLSRTTVRRWVSPSFVSLQVEDADGDKSTCRAFVTVEEGDAAPLAAQGCNSCNEIRYNPCQYESNPDVEQFLTENGSYLSGGQFYWYADDNGSKGPAMNASPAIDVSQLATHYYWVAQDGECAYEGEATRIRIKVKRTFMPDFTLPSISCGGTQIDLAAYVSDPKNKATAYTFYNENPVANPLASPIGQVSASKGVVDFGQHAIAAVGPNNKDFWVQSTVPNGCGGIVHSNISGLNPTASLNPISNMIANSGDPINLSFDGQHTTQIYWFDHVSFNNPNIGIIGSAGISSLIFTASNTSSSPQTATIRVIAYNGNCAGEVKDFDITVLPGTNSRESRNHLQLSASQANAHDIELNWDINLDQELIRFEIEKKRNDGEFEAIDQLAWTGNGSYQYLDQTGMGNRNVYRLKMVFADGRSSWSDEVQIKMDYFSNKRFMAFPNPVTDFVQVKALFPLQDSYRWTLLDGMGKMIQTGEMTESHLTISLSEQAAGIYHLVMTDQAGKRYVMKVIKQ